MSEDLEALGEQIAELAAHLDAATHRLLAHVREFDAKGGWYQQGAKTCAHWLAWRVGWDLVTARERVRVANKLGEFPAIDDALRRGELSYSKVRALLRIATPANEAMILEQARLTTAAQLEKLSRKYALVQRHGEERRPEDDELRRYVRRRDTDDGMVKIEAVLHPEEAELVWAMLDHAAKHLSREHRLGKPVHDSAESHAERHPSQPAACSPWSEPAPTPNPVAAECPAEPGCITGARGGAAAAPSCDDSAESCPQSQLSDGRSATPEPASRPGSAAFADAADHCVAVASAPGAPACSVDDSAEACGTAHQDPLFAAPSSLHADGVAAEQAPLDVSVEPSATSGIAGSRGPAAAACAEPDGLGCAEDRGVAGPHRDSGEACAPQTHSNDAGAMPSDVVDAAALPPGSSDTDTRSLLDRLLDEAEAMRAAAEPGASSRGDIASLLGAAHATPSSPVPAQPSVLRQRVDAAQRAFDRADALVSISQAYLRGERPDRAPVDVMITIPASSLRKGAADTVDVGCMGDACLSAETARRLSCDAGVIEVIEDEDGVPLSVGRKRRTIAGSIKRALLKRDGACCYPGCTHRTFLEGHHIEHWADGGATALHNGALLCSHHHRYVHEYGYTIELGDDQRPRFRDPRGRLVAAVPVRHAGADLGWPHLLTVNAPLGIDAGSLACEWDGRPADYGRMVGELVVVDGLT